MYTGDTLNVHAKFTGDVADGIEAIIKLGRAASKTEAIRIAVLDYVEHHVRRQEHNAEDQLTIKKVLQLENEAKEGKRRTLSEEEALAKYKHLLK